MGDNAEYPVHMSADDGVLRVHSDVDPDQTRWWKEVNWRRGGEKAFANFLQDYPTITVTVPQGTDLALDSVVTELNAGDINGDLLIEHGHVRGEAGDMNAADINIHGSADFKLGSVADSLDINIHGSGDVTAGSAGSLSVSIHGSGDVRAGDVDGETEIRIAGSGDVRIGNVGGEGEFAIHGSGDISTGALEAGAEIALHGSGDVSLASVAGGTSVDIHGSGGSSIGGGRAEDLKVRVRGSGDFRHNGLATNPDVSVRGSGDVYIKDAEGPVRASGDGDIRIAGRQYGDDD